VARGDVYIGDSTVDSGYHTFSCGLTVVQETCEDIVQHHHAPLLKTRINAIRLDLIYRKYLSVQARVLQQVLLGRNKENMELHDDS